MLKFFLALNNPPRRPFLLRKVRSTRRKRQISNLSLQQDKAHNNPTLHPLFLTTIHTPRILKANTMAPPTILDMCHKASSNIRPCSNQVLKALDPPLTPPPNNLLVASVQPSSHKPTPMAKGYTNKEAMTNTNLTLIIRSINTSIAIASDCLKVLSVPATTLNSFTGAGLRVVCKASWV